MLRCANIVGLGACLMAGVAAGDVVVLTPAADNTMYESSVEDQVSNGLGHYLFCGKTQTNSIRRALVRFDVSGIPAGSVVTGAELRLDLNRGDGLGGVYSIHRVTGDWGVGTSDAGEPGGLGALATPGDATWHSAFFGGAQWQTPGGDYVLRPSAAAAVGSPGVVYAWGSSDDIVADVQAWVDGGAGNYGWVLLGAEDVLGSALRWSSMEGPVPPTLTVTFTPPVTCGTQDYNGDGDFGTDQDIEAFFACLAGSCCAACCGCGQDFNGDGDFGTDQDIESFFRVLAGGPC